MKQVLKTGLTIFALTLLTACVGVEQRPSQILCALVAGGAAGGIAAAGDVEEEGAAALAVGAGLMGYFGCAENRHPKDSDGDGISDGSDACPDTQPGAPVDTRGCARDSDGDGVIDLLDRCPRTPRGVSVDSDGCPLDSDGDGVSDSMDECSGTPRGVAVRSNGCPENGEKLASLRNIQFELNSAKLSVSARMRLDETVALLKSHAKSRVRIEGHTCNLGTEAYNQGLSEKRAQAVLDYLVSRGVPASQMESAGYGESQPIADNATKAGREQNRRVDFVVID